MPNIVIISGSPKQSPRNSATSSFMEKIISAKGKKVSKINVHEPASVY